MASSDSTYYASQLALWLFAEMACMFLVLCMPSTPKVFRSVKVLSTLKWVVRPCVRRTSSEPTESRRDGIENLQSSEIRGISHRKRDRNHVALIDVESAGPASYANPISNLTEALQDARSAEDRDLNYNLGSTRGL